jgi:hypothetical protein
VEIAIGTSVVVHVLLILVLLWQWGSGLAERWMEANRAAAVPKEVTLLYPEQIIEIEVPALLETPKPKPEPQQYIRTTQNTADDEAPMKADFISDRNTKAASELPPEADGEPNMPTQDGIDPKRLELANRDYKDGEIKEDGATPVPEMRVAEARPPSSPVPPSILKPADAPAPPAPAQPAPPEPAPPVAPKPPPAPPVVVAKAEPLTPLEAMMKERDESDAARIQLDRLPLEVKKAEPLTPEEVANLPPPAPTVAMRDDPAATAAPPQPPPTPPSPRPARVLDPVSRTAGPQDDAAFSPFTRTSKARGTISNRGAAAVNAAETPVGRYMRTVTGAVEKKWHTLRRRNADAVTFGNLRLRFYVMPNGRVEPPQILSDRSEADPRMIDFTLQAVLEAEIPPIPEELLPMLDQQRLEVEYDVLIY